jgi:two-component system response regulator AtoC
MMGTFAAIESPSMVELPPQEVIFGRSSMMNTIQKSVEKAANANIPVLLQGESGTGKEILARFIHRQSQWGSGAFVKVSCPAIPGTLLESELFGYEKGAFTGAYGTKPGRVELAHRGTLFLDEIAEFDPGLQAKLLQLLQDGEFCRIGAQEAKRIELRLLSATNRQLEREIESGTFRPDLFYRINGITLELPPLRDRRGDIPTLANYFLEIYSREYGRPLVSFSGRFLQIMKNYRWPGNIRELENVIRRYVVLGSEDAIISTLLDGNEDFLIEEIPSDGVIPLKKVLRKAAKQLERKIILRMLEAHGWNRTTTARVLCISYPSLLSRMREAGLPPTRGPKAKRFMIVESEGRVDQQPAKELRK